MTFAALKMRHGQPQTRQRRQAILAKSPLFATLTEPHAARLLACSSIATCPGGTVLFSRGDISSAIFLVVSGFVELRTQGAGTEDMAETALHLRLAGAGEFAAGDELAMLAAGTAPAGERRQTAMVLGDPAEIMAVDSTEFAAWLSADSAARLHVAQALLDHLAALQTLAADLVSFKNHGKIRLARHLDRLFGRMGVFRGAAVTLPHAVSHANLAASLGVTRRSVFDDMLSLEDFGAIDHDRAGRLTLRDRTRLQRIANLVTPEDRQADAETWREDVARALDAGDTLRAFELSREALVYHPRDEALRYAAVLAALRSGALNEAESLITSFRFDIGQGSEATAALAARAQKERAFAALDTASLRREAAHAAAAYHQVHVRFGGSYSLLNAAQLYCVAGAMETGLTLAAGLVRDGTGYWKLVTRAEALWLRGEETTALAAARVARQAADADEGKVATTRRQLRRLATALGRDAVAFMEILSVRPVAMCDATDPRLTVLARTASRLFVVLDGPADLGEAALPDSVELVLPAPAPNPTDAGLAPLSALIGRVPCHLANPLAGPTTQARLLHARRLALGLALLCAAEREAPVICGGENAWPDWAAADTPAGGQVALLFVAGAPVPQTVAAQERHETETGIVLRFAAPGPALRVALALNHRWPQAARCCLDIEPDATPLAEARLSQIQPAIPEAGVFATDAAAAELALQRRPDLRLQSIGLVRSRRRMNRMRLWSAQRTAAWS
jgi:CRP-like cAMP-binding protein